METTTALKRIYADISGEYDAKLETLAKANGRTKKGQIEWLIHEAVVDFEMKEAHTAKAARKGGRR